MCERHEIKFHFDEDTGIMYITRPPHRFSKFALVINDYMRLMVNEDATEVLGMVIIDYREYVPIFFKDKRTKSKKCKDCSFQFECFADHIRSLLCGEQIISRRARSKKIASPIVDKVVRVPEDPFLCEAV